MIEDKTIGQSHRRFSKLHPHRQRFECRNPCDPTDAGHLDERLETDSAGHGRGSLGSARAMRLRGRCDTIRVGVVGCGLFATPNFLKSHKRQKELSDLCNTRAITPKLCMPSRPIHPSKNYLALKSHTAARSP